MADDKRSTDTDITGRLLALEQRSKGLNARLCALELSFSAGTGGKRERAIDDERTGDVEEFFPASPAYAGAGDEDVSPNQKGELFRPGLLKVPAIDITAWFAGLILVLVGLMLYTQNLDVLKNPLSSLGCGTIILLIAAAREYGRLRARQQKK